VTLSQIVATAIFVVTFTVILSERLHRTIAAMAGATVMLCAGLLLGFYDQQDALASIDLNTLGLLLGMMILVRMLERTGFFRYVAIVAAKRTKGSPLLLFVALGTLTTVLSMFLDNATTVVLIAPVTILIAEILGISPIPMLMAEALLSDTGGVATLVGDPPNVIIGSAAGFSFLSFLTHLAPIVVVAWLVALILLRFIFRRELGERPSNVAALMRLDENDGLHDPAGLRKILITLGAVIVLFFLQGSLRVAPGAIALGGAAAALLWVRPDVEETLGRVEWWALALGAGFGGNGTPIGSTANVVTVSLSEKTRTPITTRLWLRSGLPVMLATCAVATVMFILFFGRMQTP
jgi:Na+/H+ antiporter NhaD/arsenite permease-like protein